MAILKSQAPSIQVPKEAVQVDALGGEVVVYGLGLAARLRMSQWNGPRFGQMCEALAESVRDAEGVPLYTADEWEVFGGRHMPDAIRLWQAIERVSSLDEAQAEKN
jgi:hypothetical protein